MPFWKEKVNRSVISNSAEIFVVFGTNKVSAGALMSDFVHSSGGNEKFFGTREGHRWVHFPLGFLVLNTAIFYFMLKTPRWDVTTGTSWIPAGSCLGVQKQNDFPSAPLGSFCRVTRAESLTQTGNRFPPRFMFVIVFYLSISSCIHEDNCENCTHSL